MLPTRHVGKANPKSFLTDRRIQFHNQHRYDNCVDLRTLDENMSDLIGFPKYAQNSVCWTYAEMGQPAPRIPLDLYPSVSTLPLGGDLLRRPVPSNPPVPLCQDEVQDYNQILGGNFQQTQWNPALRDPRNQTTIPPIQQNQPSLSHTAYEGAAYVAPQLLITDATSNYFQQTQWTPTQPCHNSATFNSGSAAPASDSSTVLELSRLASPNLETLTAYGFKHPDNSWSCAMPGCTSLTRFTRACDLRKHYNRHSKTFFCRYNGCPKSTEAGFSTRKDRARHESKHNPMIVCEWKGCGRLFSRVDNMVGRPSVHRTAPFYLEASC